MKKLLTLLLVLAVVVGATATIGFAAETQTLNGETSVTISEDTTLDMNGHDLETLIVNPGVTVTLTNVGENTIGEITGGGVVQLADGYMLFEGGNKLTLGTAGISLRADNLAKNGASVYYTSTFGGNATVLGNIKAYGVAMYVGNAKNLFADNTYTRNEDLSEWNTSVATFNDTGVLLKGILKTGNAYSVNKSNATKQIYNVPYVELADGTRITGATVNRSLQDVVETATGSTNPGNDYWDTYSYTQKTNIVNLYDTFERFMSNWNMPRLTPLVDNKTSTVYTLYNASDVQLMSQFPNNSYYLDKYINMGGVTLNTIENFTGSIDGNGHTIRFFTLNGTGFVDQVAAGQSITDLYLCDVAVVVPSDNEAMNVGIIAGTNNGSITACAASGTIKDTRKGSKGAEINVGALVGNNAGTLTTYPILEVEYTLPDVTGAEQTYTTTGLSADVGLFVEKSDYVNTGLVGTGNAVSNAETVYWRDRSYSTERQAKVLQDRRQTAVDYVYQSGTIKWTVPSTIAYYADQKNYPNMEKPSNWWDSIFSGKWHIHNQQFTKGTTYVGIPYTHCSSSLEQATYYMTEGANGVYTLKSEIAQIKGGSNSTAGNADWESGNIGWGKYLGSDCSSALTMGWHKVSQILTSSKTNGGVCLLYTNNIVPSQYNQWYYGIRQVGDFEVDDATWSSGTKGSDVTAGGVTMNDYAMTTDDIFKKIGANGFYEAYAQTQMGDILNSSGTAGHSRMAALDPVVIRNGKGVIDPAKSYFVTHEQGDGLYDRETTNSSWRINYQYTFEQLAYQTDDLPNGSNGYYLPVSMDAFHDAKLASSGNVTLSGGRAIGDTNDPSYVVLNASFRIQSATMTIMDAPNGNVLYQKTAFQGTSSNQNRRRATPGNIPMYMSEFFSDYGANLTEGQTYYFTLSGTTFTGNTTNVYTNQAFVYTPAA